jgi:AcrR family transcriptional regulator
MISNLPSGFLARRRNDCPMNPRRSTKRAVPRAAAPSETRERIKQLARDHYVLYGNDAFNFGEIAKAIGTTRANIHHHFGSKRKLISELVRDLTDDAEKRIQHHWARPGVRFSQRLVEQLEDLRRFYQRFHSKRGDRNVWSPLARIRLDLPMLDKTAANALERINTVYDKALHAALVEAVAAGELVPATPIRDIGTLLRVTFLSCPPMTQDRGTFLEIEQLFAALDRTITGAWGGSKARQ